jgi:hypothetical protein
VGYKIIHDHRSRLGEHLELKQSYYHHKTAPLQYGITNQHQIEDSSKIYHQHHHHQGNHERYHRHSGFSSIYGGEEHYNVLSSIWSSTASTEIAQARPCEIRNDSGYCRTAARSAALKAYTTSATTAANIMREHHVRGPRQAPMDSHDIRNVSGDNIKRQQ